MVLFLGVAMSGCSRETNFSRDSAAAVVASIADSSAPVALDSASSRAEPCPHNGFWARCSVERRLRQSGFVVTRVDGESPRRSGFSVTPTVYTLGRARLEVFIYESEPAMERDIASLDTLAVAPRGSAPAWESTPLLIRSGNLAAVLLTENPRQAERVMLALTAGAPQPGSPR